MTLKKLKSWSINIGTFGFQQGLGVWILHSLTSNSNSTLWYILNSNEN